MPYTPRRYAHTTGVAPELAQKPVSQHSPIPVRKEEEPEQKPARLSLGLKALDMSTYEPDFNSIYRSMFGKEPNIDPVTQQLVHAQSADAKDAFGQK